MPLRPSRTTFPIPISQPSFSPSRIRPQYLAPQARRSRPFSSTCCCQVTQRRRKFYDWLNGPGRPLKSPLPGSTNYLGAYDKYGTLVRAGPGWRRDEYEAIKVAEAIGADKSVKKETRQAQQNVDEPGASMRAVEEEGENQAKEKAEDDNKLPPEAKEDLQPFPLNQFFRSQSVLSEDLREAIFQRVKRDGANVSLASVEFGVSNERIGAVVRLKQLEKEWIAQGKLLAVPYSKAVLDMLPTTPYIDPSKPGNKGARLVPHEPINDLSVHPATGQQLFVPVAESRHFTRVDASKAFDNNLLPSDARVPHPELVLAERERQSGLSMGEREKLAEARNVVEEEKRREKEARKQRELKALKVVPQRRWDFVFTDVHVEDAGYDGKGVKAAGWRYGVPPQDRKRGQVKIPTKVEA